MIIHIPTTSAQLGLVDRDPSPNIDIRPYNNCCAQQFYKTLPRRDPGSSVHSNSPLFLHQIKAWCLPFFSFSIPSFLPWSTPNPSSPLWPLPSSLVRYPALTISSDPTDVGCYITSGPCRCCSTSPGPHWYTVHHWTMYF